MNGRFLPTTSARANAPSGLGAGARITARVGRIIRNYPKSGKVRILLESGDQRVVDYVPVVLPCFPNMPPGTPVLVDYIRGEPTSPIVVAALDPQIVERSIMAKLPYAAEGLDMTNARVWEFVHELGGDPEEDIYKVYPSLVSWLRMTRDGHLVFKHLQPLPNPMDGLGADAPELAKKVFTLDIGADDGLSLAWPYRDRSNIRTVKQSVGEDGEYAVEVTTDAAGKPPVSLRVTEDGEVAIESGKFKLGYKDGTFTVENDAALLTLGQDTVQLNTTGLTLQFADGKLTIAADGDASITADKATLKAGSITLDSTSILMGKMNRPVAFKGGRVAAHSHKYYSGGRQYNTTSVAPKIAEGANEVKV